MRLIGVFGMHRSGTSALTRTIMLLGADVGPAEELLPPNDDNPEGFWEPRALVDINNRILRAFDGHWSAPPLLASDWVADPRLDGLRAEATGLLDAFRSLGAPCVVWKDPRLSLLWPFWEELQPFDAVTVALRHPSEVATSLALRNQLPRETAAALWLRYLAAALVRVPRHVVHYESLLTDTEGESARLAAALDLPAPSNEALGAIRAAVRSDLRHHTEAPIDIGPIEATAVGIHARLLTDPTELAEPLGLRVLHLVSRADTLLGAARWQQLDAERLELAGARAELTRLRRSGDEHEDRIAELETRLAAADQGFAHLRTAFVETVASHAALVREARYADDEVVALRQRIDELEQDRAVTVGEWGEATRREASNLRADLAAARREQQVLRALLADRERPSGPRIDRESLRSRRPAELVRSLRPAPLRSREEIEAEVDRDALVASGLFDAEWYLGAYPDVASSGADPLDHYLAHGAAEHRNPNAHFDTAWYLAHTPEAAEAANPLLHYLYRGTYDERPTSPTFNPSWYLHANPDVLVAGVDPLVHFLRYGELEGRPGTPDAVTRPVGQLAESFDARQHLARLAAIDAAHRDMPARYDAVPVSIVMATWNRGDVIASAVQSVLTQSHPNWELLVVDDGSTDDTNGIVRALAAEDERIRYIPVDHQGVSAARNRGLDEATGDLVAYLDSDNTWEPDFLRAMVVSVLDQGFDCAYAAMAVLDETGSVVGYRGDDFDWDECRRGNYIDINVFCHRRGLLPEGEYFDEQLRRMVDWDYILRLTHDRHVGYVPVLGARYQAGDGAERISNSAPLAFGEVVRAKIALWQEGSAADPLSIARRIRFRVLVRIAAPYAKRDEWGDFHYAVELVRAFEDLGHEARIEFLDHDEDTTDWPCHVSLTLRGLTRHPCLPGAVNVLWSISHPDQLAFTEMEEHDLVYVASESYAALVPHCSPAVVRHLPQATAAGNPLRHPVPAAAEAQGRALFVGNSRNVLRPMVAWSEETGTDLVLVGSGWEQFVGAGRVAYEHLPNQDLPAWYRTAGVVLNDHWESMRDFGYVSNRVLDVIAAGGQVVTDPVAGLEALVGGPVATAASAEELVHVLDGLDAEDPDQLEARRRRVVQNHSFVTRARQITNDVLEVLSLPPAHACPTTAPRSSTVSGRGRDRLRVLAVVPPGGSGPQSSAYIRVICPLTSATVADDVDLNVSVGPPEKISGHDVVLVQRNAFGADLPGAHRFLDQIGAEGTRLVFDLDDALALLDASHPERDVYLPQHDVVALLASHADLTWLSTRPLADLYEAETDGRAEVVPNSLDHRLWRDYRRPFEPTPPGEPARIVYMGTATHDADFGLVAHALDAVNAVTPIEVTIIGAVRSPGSWPWLRVLPPPPGEDRYPRFAQWLRRLPRFDVGIAPLVDTAFNRCKSDIKLLDYCAMGALAVASDLTPYRSTAHKIGVPLTEGSVAGWRDALLGAIDDSRSLHGAEQRAAYVWEHRSAAATGTTLLHLLRESAR